MFILKWALQIDIAFKKVSAVFPITLKYPIAKLTNFSTVNQSGITAKVSIAQAIFHQNIILKRTVSDFARKPRKKNTQRKEKRHRKVRHPDSCRDNTSAKQIRRAKDVLFRKHTNTHTKLDGKAGPGRNSYRNTHQRYKTSVWKRYFIVIWGGWAPLKSSFLKGVMPLLSRYDTGARK